MKINDLNIAEVAKYPKERLNKIKREVLLDNELIEIPASLLPETFNRSYYFISYSHRDFRLVYNDIINLEEGGMNIWYDRSIPAGRNWKDVANDYMFPSECRGVIFYLSENSLISDSVIDEIKYAKKLKKTVIIIMLPFDKDYIYQGQSTLGKYFSAYQMALILKENGFAITQEKLDEIAHLVPDELLYLPYNMEISAKIEKIEISSPPIPDFDTFIGDYSFSKRGRPLVVDKLNNYKISKIDESSFELEEKDVNQFNSISFNSGVCANLSLLESLSFKNRYRIDIGSFAFSRCSSLNRIAIEDFKDGNIGDYAFSNCDGLKDVSLNNVFIIGDYAFSRCSNLESVALKGVDTIGAYAFWGNEKLTRADFSDASEIKDGAFSMCRNLKEVIWNKKANYKSNIFAYNYGIEEINLDLSGSDVHPFFMRTGKNGSIDEASFTKMYKLKLAYIKLAGEEGVSSFIPKELFFDCSELESVRIASNGSFETVEESAFADCVSLSNVIFDILPKKIESRAFAHCNELDTLFSKEKGSLDLSNLTSIGSKAFEYCHFKKVIFGSEKCEMGYDIFLGCKHLEEVEINRTSVNEEIIHRLFRGNNALKHIVYKGRKEEFKCQGDFKPTNPTPTIVSCLDGDLEIYL